MKIKKLLLLVIASSLLTHSISIKASENRPTENSGYSWKHYAALFGTAVVAFGGYLYYRLGYRRNTAKKNEYKTSENPIIGSKNELTENIQHLIKSKKYIKVNDHNLIVDSLANNEKSLKLWQKNKSDLISYSFDELSNAIKSKNNDIEPIVEIFIIFESEKQNEPESIIIRPNEKVNKDSLEKINSLYIQKSAEKVIK